MPSNDQTLHTINGTIMAPRGHDGLKRILFNQFPGRRSKIMLVDMNKFNQITIKFLPTTAIVFSNMRLSIIKDALDTERQNNKTY